jgi:hypothetical protein
MVNQSDYRLYLNERFEGLTKLMNAQFEIIHNNLDAIKKQTTETNSRVTYLEEDVEELEEKVDEAITYGNHVIDTRAINCPNVKRIEGLEKDVKTIGIWKSTEEGLKSEDRYYIDHRIKIWGTLVASLLLIVTIYFGVRKYNNDIKQIKNELGLQNELLIENGGGDAIKNKNTRGITIDSLKIDDKNN